MNTGQSANNWRDGEGTTNAQGDSSQHATGLNQSFREQQEEDDYDEENDAGVFDATKLPQENYGRGRDSNQNDNQYYDESNNS